MKSTGKEILVVLYLYIICIWQQHCNFYGKIRKKVSAWLSFQFDLIWHVVNTLNILKKKSNMFMLWYNYTIFLCSPSLCHLRLVYACWMTIVCMPLIFTVVTFNSNSFLLNYLNMYEFDCVWTVALKMCAIKKLHVDSKIFILILKAAEDGFFPLKYSVFSSPESLRWPIAMALRPSCVIQCALTPFFQKLLTEPVFTKFGM